MLLTDGLSDNVLRGIAAGITTETLPPEGEPLPTDLLERVRQLNAFQGIDAYLRSNGVEGKTGSFIQALDELRSAERPDEG